MANAITKRGQRENNKSENVAGHQLHALGEVLALDGNERVAGEGQHDPAEVDNSPRR